jgi:hypothetical protein
MRTNHRFRPLTAEGLIRPQTNAKWVWDGYLARRGVTLLTSQWKCGKTTLVGGLLRAMATGGPFLGQGCVAGRAAVVSEEPEELWAERLAVMPAGPHAEVLPRPFRTRPSAAEWRDLVDDVAEKAAAGAVDLFVVDPLASFLPMRSENDAASVLDAIQPVQAVAAAGAAVLVLHHPRKAPAEEGCTARGSGALTGFVDIVLELTRFGRLRSDNRYRRLAGFARYRDTPRELYYTWDPATGGFEVVPDPHAIQFRANWEQVHALLKNRPTPASHIDLLADWPANQPPPARATLYEWLGRAHDEKLVRRTGGGTKANPFRYRLPNEDDAYYDRGELPPLKPLFGFRD